MTGIVVVVTHGTLTSWNKGCRCEACTDGKRAHREQQRVKYKEAAARAASRLRSVIGETDRAALEATDASLPDGWTVTHVVRAGLTWTASASPFGEAFEHYRRLTGLRERPMVQGQGNSATEALGDLVERIAVTLDPRLKVYRVPVVAWTS